MSFETLAAEYQEAVHAAANAAVDGEEEAQLTVPISVFLSGLTAAANLGALHLVRETRLDRTRPDFAAIITRAGRTQQKGFIELKAPTVSVNTASWRGRNAQQWQRLQQDAEILIVCNGVEAQLYHEGVAVGETASLPYETLRTGNRIA